MILNFIKRWKRRKNKVKKNKKKEKIAEEKMRSWTEKWRDDKYRPFWNLEDDLTYFQELIDKGILSLGDSILDIGCGSGEFASELANMGFNVHAFDFAQTAVERAKSKHHEKDGKLQYFSADATKLLPIKGKFKMGLDKGTFHVIPRKSRLDYKKNIAEHIEDEGFLLMIYAEYKAHKLSKSTRENINDLLLNYIGELFDPEFEIIDSKLNCFICHMDKRMPCFMILMKKKSGLL